MKSTKSKIQKQCLWAFVGLATMVGAPMAASAEVPESDRTIRLTLNDWTGQNLTTNLMGRVLEEMGYSVEYVPADYIAQFTGLAAGDLHVAMEIWETTARDQLEQAVAQGDVVDLGETGMHAIEEWWYPSYVKDLCPGLPDWEALRECADVFATPETQPEGRYLGGPVTWGGYDEERIEALDLPFEVIHAGTDAALFAEIRSAYQREAPIIAWVYSPHWAPIQFDGEWVEFPEYTQECYEDPSWGINPDMAYDCGKPQGWIKKAGWPGLEAEWPAAYEAISNFTIDNETIGEMIGQVDLDGMPLDMVADQWIAENEDVWSAWISN